MKTIEINPDPEIRVMDIDGNARCVVIDDFLADPGGLVEYASAHAADFELQAIGYPGVLYDVNPNLQVKSITGWRKYKFSGANDLDGTNFSLFHAGQSLRHRNRLCDCE